MGVDGVKVAKVAAVAIEGMSSFTICDQVWHHLLQAVVGAEQAIYPGAPYRREMQPVV